MGQSMADQATLRSGSDGEGTPTAQVGLKVRWEDRHSYILAPGQKWTKRGIFAVVKRA
jgi:hypothetical protein